MLELKIVSSRVFFFDNLLQNIGFNILFTSFCLLILVNGSYFIDGLNGLSYGNFAGICLEDQKFPDSVNKSDFPSIISSVTSKPL